MAYNYNSNVVLPINYILNSGADNDTLGWATYANAVAGPVPQTGTGGSPQASLWIRSTASPLRKNASFRLDKTGSVTRQGQGASYAFTIDKADTAKVLTISFDYEVVSGTYADADLAVYIYDVTNAQVIQPAGFSIEALGSGVQNKLIATFQTASNSTSYRLILHVASASTQNYTLAFDNITVGPQTVQYGAPITDWVVDARFSWGGSLTSLGNGFSSFRSRRVGDFLEVEGGLVVGSTTATTSTLALTINLSGITIDLNKARNTTAPNVSLGGAGYFLDSSTNVRYLLNTYLANSTTINIHSSANSSDVFKSGTPVAFATNDTITVRASFPVAGWGSSVVMSDTTDSRVVSLLVQKTGNEAVTAGVTNVQFTSVAKDSHGGWNGTTTYTVPVPGDYIISGACAGSGNGELFAWVNGSRSRSISGFNTVYYMTGSCLIPNLKAGDLITVRSSVTTTIQAASTDSAWLSISRVSGPSSIAATESVNFRAGGASTSVTSGASPTTVIYTTVAYDSHSAYNSSTGIYTIPVSGKYRITAYARYNAFTAVAANRSSNLYIFKNGLVTVVSAENRVVGHTVNQEMCVSTNGTTSFIAGDTIRIGIDHAFGPNASLSGNPNENLVMIERVGN